MANALPVVCQPTGYWRVPHLRQLRVADISCGSGAFLVAAARYLSAQLLDAWDDVDLADALDCADATDPTAAARYMAISLLYGVDIDAVSVELTRLALQLLVPEQDASFCRIRVGDALVGRTHPDLEQAATYPSTARRIDWDTEFPDVFDAIIGNPPYLGGQKLAGAFGAAYREHIVRSIAADVRGSADLAVYFWLRAHQLVNDFGVVAMITTNTLLQGASGRVGHDQLIRWGWRLYRRITSTPWPTPAAAVDCAVVWTVLRSAVPGRLEFLDDLFGPPLALHAASENGATARATSCPKDQ